MTKPTPDEIKEQIKWLKDNKSKVRRKTMFCDDNWEAIDAEIMVMEEDLDEDYIYEKLDGEEWGEHTKEAALGARRWMDGEEETSPQDNYESLIFKPKH